MPIIVTMTEKQVKIAISILHGEIGYCGDDDGELSDLVETLERLSGVKI